MNKPAIVIALVHPSSLIPHPSSLPKKRAMGFEPTTTCLEGRGFTIKLHPRIPSRVRPSRLLQPVGLGREGFEPPKVGDRQIYSLVQ